MNKIKRSFFSVIVAFAIGPVLAIDQTQAADTAMIEQGARIYAQSCAVCHQADAIGKPGFCPIAV